MVPIRRSVLASIAAGLLGAVSLAAAMAPGASGGLPAARAVTVANGTVGEVYTPWDLEAIRDAIRSRESGTYIAEMLAGRDSALARWAPRGGMPIRVWVRSTSDIAHWTPGHSDEVRAAFEEWNDVGLPVRFAFVADSADAEVHVTWTNRFSEPISGRTRWARDDGWWITDGVITLAVHHHQGLLLDANAIRAMALHEIGHLLGLDHTVDQGSVMARRVRVRGIAPVDVATAELLYAVPAGRIR
jgi:hypothetical protein